MSSSRTQITSGDRSSISSSDRTQSSAGDTTSGSPEDDGPWYFPETPTLYIDTQEDDTLPSSGSSDQIPKNLRKDSEVSASQGTAANQPTVNKDSKGRKYWDFDGSDDRWAISNFDHTPALQTIVWVAEGVGSRNDRILNQREGSGNPEVLTWIAQTSNEPNVIVNDSAGNSSSFVSPSVDGAQLHVTVIRLDWPSNVLRVWADDGSGLAKDGDGSTGWTDNEMVSSSDKLIGKRPSNADFFAGKLYSIIEFPSILTDSETTTLMNQLVNKWNIT